MKQMCMSTQDTCKGGGTLEASLPAPSGPKSHLQSPQTGCRCGLTMQCRYQILGCGAKPFHTPDMAAVLGGRQGRFIVLILRMRKLSLEEGQ